MTLLEVAKHALEAMEDAMYRADTHEFYDAKESLRYAIEQAEQQEPVAWNWMQDGQPYSPAYYGPPPDDDVVRIGLANGRSVRLLYTAPTPRKPLTDEACDSILLALDEWARDLDHYEYGLPLYNEELREKAREVIRAAHGIGEHT